jgi:F0F1-type ATP synthase assembly protein I
VRETISHVSVIIELGTIVVVSTLLPLFIGIWLDSQFQTTPWITMVSVVAGVILAVAGVYRVISEQYKKYS